LAHRVKKDHLAKISIGEAYMSGLVQAARINIDTHILNIVLVSTVECSGFSWYDVFGLLYRPDLPLIAQWADYTGISTSDPARKDQQLWEKVAGLLDESVMFRLVRSLFVAIGEGK
jgi:hypothetical protein